MFVIIIVAVVDDIIENQAIPAGYPVVCVTPCDPKYPDYNATERLCREMAIDVSNIRFSWEISPPTVDDQTGTALLFIDYSFVRQQELIELYWIEFS